MIWILAGAIPMITAWVIGYLTGDEYQRKALLAILGVLGAIACWVSIVAGVVEVARW